MDFYDRKKNRVQFSIILNKIFSVSEMVCENDLGGCGRKMLSRKKPDKRERSTQWLNC